MTKPGLLLLSLIAGTLGALHLLPAPAHAQELGTDCELLDFRVIQSRATVTGARVTWLGRPSLRCPNGLRIRSDSAVVYEQTGRNELIGNVRFDTPERELRARTADWFERDGRLFARGDVFLRDLIRGTEVEGDTLIYLEAGPQRAEDNLTVYGGRPRAVLVPAGAEVETEPPVDPGDVEDPQEPEASGTPPGESPASEPYRVVANRLRFQGERFFFGDGEVEVERGDLNAVSDSLAFDQEAGDLILMRDARVTRGEVTATGGILNLQLRDERLESLRSRREGVIETQDFVLTGEDLQIFLNEDETVRSVTAQGGNERLATVASDDIFLHGREIRIEEESDGGRIVRALGEGRGESLARVGETPMDPESGLPDRDWIEGNEVVAYFVESDQGPDPETGEERYQLQRLEATGSARTLYRSAPDRTAEAQEEEDGAPEGNTAPEEAALTGENVPGEEGREPEAWAISYVLADRIVIHMLSGEVDRLETHGNVRGLQLDPDRRGNSTGVGSDGGRGPSGSVRPQEREGGEG